MAWRTMSIAPARRAALRALARIRRDEAFSGAVVAKELSLGNLSVEDAALATYLIYGVTASTGVLDEAIGRFVTRTLEPRVRDALRLGAYELLFGHAPVYAVVDQTVSAVRAVRPQAAGLANAVMRKLAAIAPEFPWGNPAKDRSALARSTAHPEWIADLFIEALGETRGRAALISGMAPAPTYIRMNPFAADPAKTLESLTAAQPRISPPDRECWLLESPSAAFRTEKRPLSWFAMDAAAQIAPRVCRPAPGMQIADVGAGRGNKTMCLQSLALSAGGPADITAVEVHPGKVEMLRRRLADSGVPSVRVTEADGCTLETVFGRDAFDVVLVDAPCSGLGTLRRYPEKRWRLSADGIPPLVALQRALLVAASRVVRKGGCVVYSTCSVVPLENRDVVKWFLGSTEGGDFIIEPLCESVPVEWDEFITAEGCFQSWPETGGPDGHFVAVLRRHHV